MHPNHSTKAAKSKNVLSMSLVTIHSIYGCNVCTYTNWYQSRAVILLPLGSNPNPLVRINGFEPKVNWIPPRLIHRLEHNWMLRTGKYYFYDGKRFWHTQTRINYNDVDVDYIIVNYLSIGRPFLSSGIHWISGKRDEFSTKMLYFLFENLW